MAQTHPFDAQTPERVDGLVNSLGGGVMEAILADPLLAKGRVSTEWSKPLPSRVYALARADQVLLAGLRGSVAAFHAETGEVYYVDTSSQSLRKKYWVHMLERKKELTAMLKRSKIDRISLMTGKPYEDELIRFFKKRMKQFR